LVIKNLNITANNITEVKQQRLQRPLCGLSSRRPSLRLVVSCYI